MAEDAHPTVFRNPQIIARNRIENQDEWEVVFQLKLPARRTQRRSSKVLSRSLTKYFQTIVRVSGGFSNKIVMTLVSIYEFNEPVVLTGSEPASKFQPVTSKISSPSKVALGLYC